MRFLTVVEISASKVAIAVGYRNGIHSIRVAAHHSVSLPKSMYRGDMANERVVNSALIACKKAVETEFGYNIKEVILVISSAFISSSDVVISRARKNSSQYITRQEIDSIISEALKSKVEDGYAVLEAIPQSFNIDDNIGLLPNEVEGTPGGNIEAFFKVFVGKRSIVEKRRDVIEKCSMKVIGTTISVIGSAMSSLNPTESENGAALVDIGASTTSVSIVKDNIVRDIGIIPFGGNNITNDIKNICCITFETAEKVKINFSRCVSEGSSDTKKIIIKGIGGSDNVEIPLSKLAKIIEARTSELFDAILYIIERCGYLDKIPAGIVITGGGAYSEHISQLARALCGVPIRIGNCMGTIDDKSPESCYDTYASSIVGALIQSYENYSMYEDRLSDAIVVNRSSNEPKLFDDHFSNEDNTAPDNTFNDDKDNTIDSRDKGKSEGGGIFKGLKGLFGNRNKQKEDDPKKSGNFMESIFGGKYNDEV